MQVALKRAKRIETCKDQIVVVSNWLKLRAPDDWQELKVSLRGVGLKTVCGSERDRTHAFGGLREARARIDARTN
eukprot:4460048-Pleurochrysis_carterae.AAC.1